MMNTNMNVKSIIYTSNTGHTKEYAELLSKQLNIPAYSLNDKKSLPDKNTAIVYLGWIYANHIVGLNKVKKKYNLSLVCAVGLTNDDSKIDSIRLTNKLPSSIPLFTLQGGIDQTKLKGLKKFMISMLTKGLKNSDNKSKEDEELLNILINNENKVSLDNLTNIINFIKLGL